jgi:23S rRNA pseudouridine955/2504/2580 synthase
VGDGKYGGQDAFLTGSISRKMHLHARRLIIEHPDGVPLDATAELPEHFAASMEQLGFDEKISDAEPEKDRGPMPKALQKKSAKQHSKQIRKDQRSERRGGGSDAPKRKLGKKSKAKFAKPGHVKPGAKPGRGSAKKGPSSRGNR